MLRDRAWSTVRLAVILTVVIVPSAYSQTDPPLDGRVISESGQPIEGVSVTGSRSKTCCPFKSDSTYTDATGAFHLEHPGGVVHFFDKAHEPQILIVKPEVAKVEITLASPSNDLVMPNCTKPDRSQREIGWGKYGLHFFVPRKGMNVSGGKSDADYTVFFVRSRTSPVQLQLWFGAYAMGLDPEDEVLINSATFSQKRILNAEGELVGTDSRGQLQDGLTWRQTAAGFQGAKYRAARRDDAELFDRIIGSVCWMPYRE
jgi:hypothetical protein